MAWLRDNGKRFAGQGQLKMSVTARGVAQGEATGPLGAQRLTGSLSSGGVSLRLKPTIDSLDAFAGVLLGKNHALDPALIPQGAELELELKSASGDGRWVRSGTATLRKVSEHE